MENEDAAAKRLQLANSANDTKDPTIKEAGVPLPQLVSNSIDSNTEETAVWITLKHEVIKIGQQFLRDVKWPADDVHLREVEFDKSNPHLEKALRGKLPQTPDGRPAMLFHKLGEDAGRIFSKGAALYDNEWTGRLLGKDLVIIGPHGCGKTRKLFELLCEKKGYYLTSVSHEQKNGRTALSEALSIERLQSISSRDLWLASNTNPSRFFERREVAEFAVKCVILSYAMIHRVWSEWISKEKEACPITPKSWLLVQLFPVHFLGRDYFTELTIEFMDFLPLDYFPGSLIPIGFVCVIDDAHVMGKHLENYFLSANPDRATSPRPALSPILRGIHDVLFVWVILAGTGLCLLEETIWKSLHASAFRWMRNTAQEYIFCDFQPLTSTETLACLKELLHCDRDDEYLEYVAKWLCGRPKFLATFIENVIAGSLKISNYIEEFVKQMTTNPSIPGSPASFFANLADQPAEIKLGDSTYKNPHDKLLLDTFWLSNGETTIGQKDASLVELSFGYAICDAYAGPLYIRSYLPKEPLILEAAQRRRVLIGFNVVEHYVQERMEEH